MKLNIDTIFGFYIKKEGYKYYEFFSDFLMRYCRENKLEIKKRIFKDDVKYYLRVMSFAAYVDRTEQIPKLKGNI